jgi:hypothetical protein
MKKNIINNILIYFIFLLIVLLFANYIGLNRHWSSVFDQELTLTYNALVFNNGLPHEYLAHPGYFTILFLSIYLKILNFFNFLEVHKLSEINIDNFNQSFQKLIFFTRIYSAICISIFCWCVFNLFNNFNKNKIYSFLLTLIIFSFPGVIFHVTELRTELLAMTYLILTMLCLKRFFDTSSFFYLISFFLFVYCALLNKMQIFFFIPFIFFIFYFEKKKIHDFNFSDFLFLKKIETKIILYFIILFYLILNNLPLHPFPLLSITVVFFNILLVNLFFYLIFEKKNSITNNLITVNLLIILVFVTLKAFLHIHPSTQEVMFVNLTRIMDLKQYLPLDQYEKGQADSQLIFKIFGDFFILTYEFIKKNILIINVYSFLIILNIILNIFLRKHLTKSELLFNISCIISFILICIINTFRYYFDLADHYLIFSDFFLVFSFCNFGKFIKAKYLACLFVILIPLNYSKNHSLIIAKKNTSNQIIVLCKNSYFFDWHKKINPEFFNNFCKQNI